MTDTEPASTYTSAPGVPPLRIQGYPKRRSSRSVERARASAARRMLPEAVSPAGEDPLPIDADPAYTDFLVDTDEQAEWIQGAGSPDEQVTG